MRLKRVLKAITYLLSGFWAGLFVAQGFFVLAARNGGAPGGEAATLIAVPLMLYAGYVLGDDLNREKWFAEGYRKGVSDDYLWRPNGCHTTQPFDQDRQV